MAISVCGLILSLITLGISGILIGIYPFIKKVTRSYFFWLAFGILLLTYELVFRFADDFSNFWKNMGSGTASKGLLLDMCPFIAFVLPILMIVDYKRMVIGAFAPLAVFGALITLFGGISFQQDNYTVNAVWSAKWIFIGEDPNEMYFMIHFIQLVFGVLVLLNCRISWWKTTLTTLGITTGYFIYVYLLAKYFNVEYNATGLVKRDWIDGEYASVSDIFHVGYPGVMYLGYGLSAIAVILIIVAFWGLQKSKHYSLDGKKDLSGTNDAQQFSNMLFDDKKEISQL